MWLGVHPDSTARAAFVAEHHRRCTDRAWAERFAAACPVGDLPASAYQQRLDRRGGEELMHGIRFLGGDPRRPFVDVVGHTGALSSWSSTLRDAWGAFAPERLRVWCDGRQGPTAATGPDQWLCAGPMGSAGTASGQAGSGGGAVGLPAAEPAEAVAWAVAAYAEWARHEGWRDGRVFPLDQEQAERCAGAGGLCWMTVAGRRVGVWAARPGRVRTWQGWVVIEQVVGRAHAGHGWAAAAQRAFGARHRGQLLLGTIDAANVASLRTAARAGRRRVGAWWWLPWPGPGPADQGEVA